MSDFSFNALIILLLMIFVVGVIWFCWVVFIVPSSTNTAGTQGVTNEVRGFENEEPPRYASTGTYEMTDMRGGNVERRERVEDTWSRTVTVGNSTINLPQVKGKEDSTIGKAH